MNKFFLVTNDGYIAGTRNTLLLVLTTKVLDYLLMQQSPAEPNSGDMQLLKF